MYNTRMQIRCDIVDAEEHLELAEKRIKHRLKSDDGKWYSSKNDDKHDLEKIKAAKIILDL